MKDGRASDNYNVWGKHINNALKEEVDNAVVAKFATTASDGKTYQVDHYTLDMIISVMIAKSRPEEKEMMISVIMNCLK